MIKLEGSCTRINTWVMIITLFFLVGSSIVSVVAITTSVQDQVDKNSENINDLKEIYKKNYQNNEEFRERMAVVETQYQNIRTQLERIENKLG